MRTVAPVIVFFVFVGSYLAVMDIGSPRQTGFEIGWRRTVDGWQRLDVSPPTEYSWATYVHPSLIAALVALLSCAALLLGDPSSTNGPTAWQRAANEQRRFRSASRGWTRGRAELSLQPSRGAA